jgi:hypothetical protein
MKIGATCANGALRSCRRVRGEERRGDAIAMFWWTATMGRGLGFSSSSGGEEAEAEEAEAEAARRSPCCLSFLLPPPSFSAEKKLLTFSSALGGAGTQPKSRAILLAISEPQSPPCTQYLSYLRTVVISALKQLAMARRPHPCSFGASEKPKPGREGATTSKACAVGWSGPGSLSGPTTARNSTTEPGQPCSRRRGRGGGAAGLSRLARWWMKWRSSGARLRGEGSFCCVGREGGGWGWGWVVEQERELERRSTEVERGEQDGNGKIDKTHRSIIRFPSCFPLALSLLLLGRRERRPDPGREIGELVEPRLGRGEVELVCPRGGERSNPGNRRAVLPADALDVRGPARGLEARA